MATHPLVSQFLAIRGEPLKEIYKNYNHFLNNDLKTVTNQDEVSKFVNELSEVEKNNVQQAWFIKILNQVKDAERIRNILEGDDKNLKIMALKDGDWYVSDILVKMPVSQVVNEVFPCMSSVIRRRILKKLAVCLKNNFILGEEYFDALNERYGINIAVSLISVCSNEKVEKIILNYGNLLTENQKKKLEKRTPKVLDFLVENAVRQENTFSFEFKFELNLYEKTKSKLISKKLNDAFFSLFQNNEFGFVESKHCIRALKSKIISEPYNFNFLNKKAIGRCLTDSELTEYYKNFFPADSTELTAHRHIIPAILEQKPFKNRYEIISTAYKQKYNRELLDNTTKFIDWDCIMEIAPYDKRQKLYELSKVANDANEKYAYFLKPDILFETSKQKVSLMKSVQDRAELYCTIVQSCKINREYEFVGVLLNYLLERHKNEAGLFWNKILDSFERNFRVNKVFLGLPIGTFSKITPHIYDSFIQVCRLLVISELEYYLYSNDLQMILMDILSYKLERNIDYSEELEIFQKLCSLGSNFPEFDRIRDYEKWRNVLIDLFKILDKKESTEMQKFMIIVDDYNAKFKKHKLKSGKPMDVFELFPEIIDKLSEDMKNDSHHVELDYINRFIAIKTNSPLKDVIFKAFWDNIVKENHFYFYYHLPILAWLLKHKPLEFTEHINDILNIERFDFNKQFMRVIRRYEHTGLPKKLTEHYNNILGTYKTDKKTDHVLAALTWFAFEKDFPDRIKDFLPEAEEIDLKNRDKEYQNKLEIQMRIPSLFSTYRIPIVLLDLAFKFMKKDFKKFGLGGLYTIICNISEKKVKELLETDGLLKDRGVSVKKHLIYITLQVLSNEERFKLLSNMAETEKNVSLLSYVLLGIFRLFCVNPKIEILQFFMEQSEKIATKPEIFEDVFLNFKIIPLSYVETYIKSILRIVMKFESRLKPKFLDSLETRELKSLSDELLDEIITLCFYNSDKKLAQIISGNTRSRLCLEYLSNASSQASVEHRTNHVINLTVKICQGADMDLLCLNESVRFNLVAELFNDIYQDLTSESFYVKKRENKDFAALFNKFCAADFGDYDKFKSHVRLQHALFYMDFRKSNSKDVNELIVKICRYFSDLIMKYGPEAWPYYATFLKDFLFSRCIQLVKDENQNRFKIECFESMDDYRLKHSNLPSSKNVNDLNRICKLILSLLPDNVPCETDEFADRYFRLIDRLGKIQDPGVKLYYSDYLQRRNI